MERSEPKNNPLITQKRINILIAEDNEINMLLTKTLVSHIMPNALLHEAHDGEEVINKMLTLSPDLILMDIQMPNMDGLKATYYIRENEKNKNIPIIALTADNVKGDKEKCLEAGMNDYINKPVSEKTLKEVLMKWLNSREKNNKAHVDFDTIHIYTLEDKEFEKMFIPLVIKSTNEALENFRSHIIQKDLIALKAAAHKLRGAAVTSGLVEINLIASNLEAIEDIQDPIVNELIIQLENEINIVQDILNEYLKRHQ